MTGDEREIEPLGALLARARVLIFDFDGTLVASNDIKWRAFEAVFQPFPDALPAIVEYCRGNNHTVRGAKFRHVYEHILRRPYTPEIDAGLHREFERLTTAAIIASPEVPGAERFLASLRGRKTVGVLSSTPHDVLLRILDARGWRHYFDVVQGAPIDKAAWLSGYQRAHGFYLEDAAFFGDTAEDRAAAQHAGWPFVGVRIAPASNEDSRLYINDFANLTSGEAG
jgi:phosphoglycolate phosphatase